MGDRHTIGHAAYLSLGSNLGDRAANLGLAISGLTGAGLSLIAASSIYETDPVDNSDQPHFLNMAVAIEPQSADPFLLLKICLEAETLLGRRRTIAKGARTIDIDLLIFGDWIIDGTRNGVELRLPHPRLHVRRFALTPLAEIAPHAVHPVYGKSIKEMLDEVDDSSSVRIYRP